MDKVLIDIRNEADRIKNRFNGADTVTVDDLLNEIENLVWELEAAKEEFEDFKRYIDNKDENEYDPYDTYREYN